MSASEEVKRKVAEAFFEAIATSFGKGREVHAGTAIAAAGRMTGAFLFRSFDFDLPNGKPGTAVLSEVANEAGPRKMQELADCLTAFGIAISDASASTPTPTEHKPQEDYLTTYSRFAGPFWAIKEQQALTLDEAASACTMTIAALIRECQATIEPGIAFGIAVYGIIEGSKTIPPFALGTSPQRPWYRFW